MGGENNDGEESDGDVTDDDDMEDGDTDGEESDGDVTDADDMDDEDADGEKSDGEDTDVEDTDGLTKTVCAESLAGCVSIVTGFRVKATNGNLTSDSSRLCFASPAKAVCTAMFGIELCRL